MELSSIDGCFAAMQLYSVSQDGALVVWESSMSLAEMQHYQEVVGTSHGRRRVSKAAIQEKVVSFLEEDEDSDVSDGETGTEGEMSASEVEGEDNYSELILWQWNQYSCAWKQFFCIEEARKETV